MGKQVKSRESEYKVIVSLKSRTSKKKKKQNDFLFQIRIVIHVYLPTTL